MVMNSALASGCGLGMVSRTFSISQYAAVCSMMRTWLEMVVVVPEAAAVGAAHGGGQIGGQCRHTAGVDARQPLGAGEVGADRAGGVACHALFLQGADIGGQAAGRNLGGTANAAQGDVQLPLLVGQVGGTGGERPEPGRRDAGRQYVRAAHVGDPRPQRGTHPADHLHHLAALLHQDLESRLPTEDALHDIGHLHRQRRHLERGLLGGAGHFFRGADNPPVAWAALCIGATAPAYSAFSRVRACAAMVALNAPTCSARPISPSIAS